MFIFSEYWRNWSRILESKNGWFVEVDLTPIPGYKWEDISQIKIRKHCTTSNRKPVEKLPVNTIKEMVVNLGEDLTCRLLEEDFLTQIDWEKFKQLNNGGVSLHLCAKKKEKEKSQWEPLI
jgi:hypothetical protein